MLTMVSLSTFPLISHTIKISEKISIKLIDFRQNVVEFHSDAFFSKQILLACEYLNRKMIVVIDYLPSTFLRYLKGKKYCLMIILSFTHLNRDSIVCSESRSLTLPLRLEM